MLFPSLRRDLKPCPILIHSETQFSNLSVTCGFALPSLLLITHDSYIPRSSTRLDNTTVNRSPIYQLGDSC
ncbi:hypothetical protein MPTK1_2g08650 [Marchantia polymorpha subsp. ruderalis]|uniref:Uncharacterized protein n=1 Tax=Marchantia polymorpha TaxID=3197 RepID=A0A2R6XGZ0_MARPO|nr:hypothetical protein MARPO_0015s0150 [Marchantia polymorpha]BBN01591.1 hypothetical protein Mp_2g08650 [Marchantia polymorpha subsp. ruderalis]|eukprot:PTQ45358.1 hypothetical protein MARPO_0015s0150 [Marchantia polymorpha]